MQLSLIFLLTLFFAACSTMEARPPSASILVDLDPGSADRTVIVESITADKQGRLYLPDRVTGQQPLAVDRMDALLNEIQTADRVGLDVFGVGEHHRAEFLDSAPALILAAAASRTSTIRLTSAVTVLSAADPVRVFQEFATLDLISKGRAELVVGRGSFAEAFPLFGLEPRNYDALFAENLGLLLTLREETHPVWRGRFRSPLTGQGVFPRPHQQRLPVWLGACR